MCERQDDRLSVFVAATRLVRSQNAQPMRKIIAYIRVSTKRQGQSGLGMDAQQRAVEAYAAGSTIVRTYTEVESGKRKDRPQLAAAIAHAKLIGAQLVIAKLDRLARNVAFVAALMESRVDFVCCDNPHASPLTIHILAAIAEDEAKRISQRTRDALAALKARGVKLGSARPGHWEGREQSRRDGLSKARIAARAARRDAAKRAIEFLLPSITAMRTDGLSFNQIAKRLNAEGLTTRNGKNWSPMAVLRACKLG